MVTEKGLSIVEIIFSIGVTVLVITGVVSLMVQSTGVKSDASQREKATVAAQKIIEDLVDLKNSDRDEFWELTPISSGTIDGFNYTVGYSGVVDGDCVGSSNCVNAFVNLSWGESQTLVVKRFFSKF